MGGLNINVEGDYKNNKTVIDADWISVEDELPEAQSDVLVSDGLNVQIAYYSNEFESFWDEDIFNSMRGMTEITHWIPLPDAP